MMIDMLLRPEFAAALLGFILWHLVPAIRDRWVRPWLADRAADRRHQQELEEIARWNAQSLKTWAEQNVLPEKLAQFLSLPLEDQLQLKKNIIAAQEREAAERRKQEAKVLEEAKCAEQNRLQREIALKALQNPKVQNHRVVDQFIRGDS